MNGRNCTEIQRFDGSAILVAVIEGRLHKREFSSLEELQAYVEHEHLKSTVVHHHIAGLKGGVNGNHAHGNAPKANERIKG